MAERDERFSSRILLAASELPSGCPKSRSTSTINEGNNAGLDSHDVVAERGCTSRALGPMISINAGGNEVSTATGGIELHN